MLFLCSERHCPCLVINFFILNFKMSECQNFVYICRIFHVQDIVQDKLRCVCIVVEATNDHQEWNWNLVVIVCLLIFFRNKSRKEKRVKYSNYRLRMFFVVKTLFDKISKFKK